MATGKRVRKNKEEALDPSRHKSDVDLTQLLPDEVLLMVFEELPVKSLLSASRVCQRWRRVAYDKVLWRQQTIVYTTTRKTVDLQTLNDIMQCAPCLKKFEIRPTTKLQIASINHKCEIGELVVDWNTCRRGVTLMRGLADSHIESLVLRNAPTTKTDITEALWEEVEQLCMVLRKLSIQWDHLYSDIPYVFQGRRDALQQLHVSSSPETFVGSIISAHSKSLRTISIGPFEIYYQRDYQFIWKKINLCSNLQELAIPADMVFRPKGQFTGSIGVEKCLEGLPSLKSQFPQLRQVSFHYSDLHADVKRLITKYAKSKNHMLLNLHLSCDNSTKSFYIGLSYDKIPTLIKCCEQSYHVFDQH